MPLKLAFMVSGRGSNLEAILAAIRRGRLSAISTIVISNNAQAKALDIAREYHVPAVAIPNTGLTRKEHERLVQAELAKHDLDFLVLAGYMRILSPAFLQRFKDVRGFYRVINIHPSLLPAFPGSSAYEDAFKAGVTRSGVTIHFVDEEVDHGLVLAQEPFERLETDTLESFKARGLAVEHRLYPAVLQMLAEGRIPGAMEERVTT